MDLPATDKTTKLERDGSLDPTLLLQALTAAKHGDFKVRLPLDWTGVAGKSADTFNEVMGLNEQLARETGKIANIVG